MMHKKTSPLQNSRGMAMVLLLVSMAVILALVGIVTASATSVSAQAAAVVAQDQCREEARTMGDSLQTLLCSDPDDAATSNSAKQLQNLCSGFLKAGMANSYLQYDSTEPFKAGSYYSVSGTNSDSTLPELELILRWTKVATENDPAVGTEAALLYLTANVTQNGASAADTGIYHAYVTAVPSVYRYEFERRQ